MEIQDVGLAWSNEEYAPLKNVVESTPGLHAAFISDIDGVSVCWAGRDGPRDTLGPMQNVSIAAENAEKLQLGQCRTIVSYTNSHVFVYFITPLLLIKLVADSSANVGVLLGLRTLLDQISANLVKVLQTDEQPTQSGNFEV